MLRDKLLPMSPDSKLPQGQDLNSDSSSSIMHPYMRRGPLNAHNEEYFLIGWFTGPFLLRVP